MLRLLTVWMLITCVAVPSVVMAEETGRGGFALRGGGSFLTQTINGEDTGFEIEGEGGGIFSAQIFYRGPKTWTIGVAAEYEEHEINVPGFLPLGFQKVGDLRTFTLMPFLELRSGDSNWQPYLTLGAGLNVNSFEESDELTTLCTLFGTTCTLETENSLAVRVGGGFDYFFTPHLAFNTEVSWKSNNGEATLTAPGIVTPSTGEFNASVASVMVGFRALF